MIQGIIIPFHGKNNEKVLSEIEKEIKKVIGYGTERVEMDKETYDAICVGDEQ